MEKALRQFLARLEAIDEEFEGLGDTNVREQMGEEIHRGFFRLEENFNPSGAYGLSPEGNRRVATTISRFVTAARVAPRRTRRIFNGNSLSRSRPCRTRSIRA